MNVIGQLKPAFEITTGYAHVQEITIIVAFSVLAAGNNQHVLLSGDFDFVGFETSDGDCHLIFILASAFDIERRIILILRRAPGIFQ